METPALSAKQFEGLFDDFVRSLNDGQRIDEAPQIIIPPDTKCADYLFQDRNVIVELKSLNKSHGDREYVLDLVGKGLAKHGFHPARREEWVQQRRKLPQKVIRFVDAKVQNSIKGAVRKANTQIRSTQNLLGGNYHGILVVANLRETLFGPIELLRYFAKHAFDRSTLAIDAVVLITPGVEYSTDGSQPQQYLVPVYRESKEYLGDFVEPLLASWIEFEAANLGLNVEAEITREFDDKSKNARPTGNSKP